MSGRDITKWPEVMESLDRLKAQGFTPEHLLAAVKATEAKTVKKERQTVRMQKPECLEGYGDGPKHCTLPVGHKERCNHK